MAVISFFRTAFDAGLAKKDGVIKPKPGVDVLFDEAKVTNLELEHFFVSKCSRPLSVE